MSRNIVIRFTLLILVCLSSILGFSQVKNNITQAIETFAKSEGLMHAAISFEAYNLSKDSVLSRYNSKMGLPPASITKLFTTAAALDILGAHYRPKTILYYDGKIDSLGILHGNLIIRGLGDPTLGSKYFTAEENKLFFLKKWSKRIEKFGITKIKGRVIADGSAFSYQGVPNGWSWSDMGNYYGAGPSGCVIFDNMAHLHFSTSDQVGGSTKIDSITPNIPNYIIHNHVKSSMIRSDNAYIYGAPYSYQHFAIGTLPKGVSNFEVKVSIPDPELLLARSLTQCLINDNIYVQFPAMGWRIYRQNVNSLIDYSHLHTIFTYEGESMKAIIDKTNLWSINLFAEQILSLIGFEEIGTGNTNESANYLNNYWSNKLDITMEQTDGSGLSRSNAFSAQHFIKLLRYMYHSPNFKTFIGSLPIAGKSGTLRNVCSGDIAAYKMHAKSGTLHHIKAYSGYIYAKNGDVIAFSFIVNNHNLSNYRIRKRMEPVFNAMASY